MIKVLSGKYKNRNLYTPDTDKTQPSKGMSKEGIFSAISPYLLDSVTLDLFAGSGALSIEALSRGAKFSYLNDNGDLAYKCILKNMQNLCESSFILTKFDYKEALKFYKENSIKFDIIFLDPPYAFDIYEEVTDFLLENNLINSSSILVFETNKELNLEKYENLYKIKLYKYGYSKVYILKGVDL